MVRWGILGTGDNALKFGKDLLIDPTTRDVHDLTHDFLAVASSTSLDKAQSFLSAVGAPSTARAYGSYEALVADPDVEIVYIASPHSHHFPHARLALTGNKHVLLEKAFTVNARQAEILVQLARERGLYLMEALWTRFFPLTRHVQQLVREGRIGTVQRVVAERNLGRDVERLYGTSHRLVNPALAGGALLDLAVYPLTWVRLFLGSEGENNSRSLQVSSAVIPYEATGVDETVTVVITSPETKTQGVATASLRVTADPSEPGVRILGTKGQVQVYGPAARPNWIRVVTYGSSEAPETTSFPIPVGHGLFWEADESARCIREGRIDSEGMPLKDTLWMMRVLDEVRQQHGLRYSEELESTRG
ncbi:dimeric dihydrodiol dehydrogenase [Aspergillus sclerotioniger CBS 115572]|uniref:D-xylose 1-dehydrogenase (NADP(+), D-xylono-1,5-lactone-forming) n=1 Tax=Aspergillus sclerotioniger CBS 115572 TaxID=1450535 RepID=A0A317X537_9EURO|nr:dimeric dihydrodiol dehydrogenase [Aspergillus sclerotioniger CBS 115572]PWY91670.1 dimeric dihydrodiol dehydrogenase [Aspergillus sclerotioniger CBS 115572]